MPFIVPPPHQRLGIYDGKRISKTQYSVFYPINIQQGVTKDGQVLESDQSHFLPPANHNHNKIMIVEQVFIFVVNQCVVLLSPIKK